MLECHALVPFSRLTSSSHELEWNLRFTWRFFELLFSLLLFPLLLPWRWRALPGNASKVLLYLPNWGHFFTHFHAIYRFTFVMKKIKKKDCIENLQLKKSWLFFAPKFKYLEIENSSKKQKFIILGVKIQISRNIKNP